MIRVSIPLPFHGIRNHVKPRHNLYQIHSLLRISISGDKLFLPQLFTTAIFTTFLKASAIDFLIANHPLNSGHIGNISLLDCLPHFFKLGNHNFAGFFQTSSITMGFDPAVIIFMPSVTMHEPKTVEVVGSVSLQASAVLEAASFT